LGLLFVGGGGGFCGRSARYDAHTQVQRKETGPLIRETVAREVGGKGGYSTGRRNVLLD